MQVLVLGGGFAGVWAAAAAVARRQGLGLTAAEIDVTVVTPNDDLVLRPRLYEDAPESRRLPLGRILAPAGIHRLAGTAVAVDSARHSVTVACNDGTMTVVGYDRLVVATGSQLVRPRGIPGAELLHDVDGMAGAVALDAHLRGLAHRSAGPDRLTAVVVGAGFAGLEVATELLRRIPAAVGAHSAVGQTRVVVVERAPVVGPELGPGPRTAIEQALEALGVEVRLGTTVKAVAHDRVVLSTGEIVPTSTVVWTAGMSASPLTRTLSSELDGLGRLPVDSTLHVRDLAGVLAAGDTAAASTPDGHAVTQSCQFAIPLGKLAGHNAVAGLVGERLLEFSPPSYVTCLDLGDAGAVFSTGWDRRVALVGERGKQRKRQILSWIEPPLDDPAELLRRADFTTSVEVTDRLLA